MGDFASDAERLRGLLDEAARQVPVDRRCRYVCVVALVRPDAEPVIARGECLGTLVEPRGDRGFGYDPAFLSLDLGVTFGEAERAYVARTTGREAYKRTMETCQATKAWAAKAAAMAAGR